MNLPESSEKVVAYHWPIVMYYAYTQLAKDYTDEQYKQAMTKYLAVQRLLVRERKALMKKVEELLDEFD